jgi:hypothetical protein
MATAGRRQKKVDHHGDRQASLFLAVPNLGPHPTLLAA